jgi:hypothetical protein
MWDRNQYRAPRHARHGYYRRSPFFGILLFILFIILISQAWEVLIPLAILAGFIFILLRSNMFGSSRSGLSGGNSNYQQPNQYYQPPPQYQPNQYYQPPASSTPPYQPYGQGYQAPPQNGYQQGAEPYQSNPSQSAPEQYEEPLAQYPQEMPPMV